MFVGANNPTDAILLLYALEPHRFRLQSLLAGRRTGEGEQPYSC